MSVRGWLSESHRPRRRGSQRVLAGVLAGLMLAAGSLLVGVPAQAAPAAPSLDCTPMGDPACRRLVPLVECFWLNDDGTKTVVWGYDNPSNTTIHIDLGEHNDMSPGDADQGQPVDFKTGTRHNVFTTTVPTSVDISWRLGNTTVWASEATSQCPSKPVPVVGSITALGLGVAGIVTLAVLAWMLQCRTLRRPVDARRAVA